MAPRPANVRPAAVGPILTGKPARSRPYRLLGAWLGPWLPVAAVLALGALLGLGVVLAGPLMAVAAAAGLVLVVLAFAYPEVVILVVLALASDLLPAQFNPFFDLPVGSLQASDALLLLLLGSVVLRVLVEPHFHLVRTPLDVPLLLFLGAVVLGFGVAVLGFGVNFSDATYEARMLAYYLLFFPITNLVRSRAQRLRLAGGLVVVGLLLSLLMLTTAALGSMPGYSERWALEEQGVARVFHPGFTVVYVALMVVLGYGALWQASSQSSTFERLLLGRREVRWVVVTILSLGLLSTLARNVVVAGAVSFVLLFVLLCRAERSRLLSSLAVVAAIIVFAIVALLALGQAGWLLDYADLYLDRIGRMFSPAIIAEGENLQPRWAEMRYAWDKLQAHPVLGIGLYNAYRPPFYEGEPATLRHFLHNAYLALWIKTGLPGLLAFLWLSALFVARGVRRGRRVQDRPQRAVVLGSVAAFVGLLLSNLVAPSFVQPGSLAVFGLILGLNEVILASEGGFASTAGRAEAALEANPALSGGTESKAS